MCLNDLAFIPMSDEKYQNYFLIIQMTWWTSIQMLLLLLATSVRCIWLIYKGIIASSIMWSEMNQPDSRLCPSSMSPSFQCQYHLLSQYPQLTSHQWWEFWPQVASRFPILSWLYLGLQDSTICGALILPSVVRCISQKPCTWVGSLQLGLELGGSRAINWNYGDGRRQPPLSLQSWYWSTHSRVNNCLRKWHF